MRSAAPSNSDIRIGPGRPIRQDWSTYAQAHAHHQTGTEKEFPMRETAWNINSKAISENWTMTVDLYVDSHNEPTKVQIELQPNPKNRRSSSQPFKLFFPVQCLPWLIKTLESGQARQMQLSEKNKKQQR
jgi:hypothetical protein